MLATGSEDGSLKLWDVRQSGNDAVCTMKLAEDGASGTSSYVMCSTASTSEDWLAFGGGVRGIGRLSACHVPSRKMLSSVPVKEYGCVQSVAYFDDGGDLATVGDSPEILHWTVDATSRTRQVSSSSSSHDRPKREDTLHNRRWGVTLVDVYADQCSRAFALRYSFLE